MNFKFSIIKIFDNDISSIEEFIASIINQKISFEKNIELIFIDLGSIDGSDEIVLKYRSKFPDNIKIFNFNDRLSAYNSVLKVSKGEYIHFCDYQKTFNKNTLYDVFESISKYSSQIDIFTLINHKYENKLKFKPKINYVDEDIVDLNKHYNHSLFNLNSIFIKRSIIGDIEFNEKLVDCADTLFISKLLLKNDKVAFIKNNYFISINNRFDRNLISKEYIQNKFNYFFNYLINFTDKPYIHYIIAKELSSIIRIDDLNDLYKTKQEINDFWENLYKVLDLIDVKFLENHEELKRIERSFLMYLINKEFHVEIKKEVNKVFIKSNEYRINSLHFHLIRIDIVEVIDNYLNISGSLTSNCYPDNISIKAVRKHDDGRVEEFIGKYVEYPTTNRKIKKFLGINWEFNYNFDLKIPLGDNNKSTLNLIVVYHDENNSVEMENSIIFREFAGLSNQGNYLIKDDRIILFKGKTFYILPYSYLKILKYEFKSIIRILRANEPLLLQAIFYRIVYVILYPFWRNKNIWLFVDRENAADDNSEHLFKYSIKQDDGIKKYFALNKDCEDYTRLNKDYDNIIPFGSFKHKLNYLFCEKIIISQVTRRRLNPFTHENSYLYEGLNTYKFCFLQHGVTKDDISWWIKKFHKNLYLFLTVSESERESIINGNYHYDENRVPVLGFPRFDNLVSNPKKEILFIPTWRRNLNTHKDILDSQYFKSINNFLTNDKLNAEIENLGYKIVFKPHPELLKFKDLFKTDNVELSDEPYQKMFEKSSLMITDFSSVAFDFAYLKKPVIYYQRDEDYHYGKGYFDYKTMGFGEVIDNEEDLVDKIIEYLEKDCLMEEEYVERVETFFKFHDKNNCKRVYDWLYSH